jgi:hypothetical protein
VVYNFRLLPGYVGGHQGRGGRRFAHVGFRDWNRLRADTGGFPACTIYRPPGGIDLRHGIRLVRQHAYGYIRVPEGQVAHEGFGAEITAPRKNRGGAMPGKSNVNELKAYFDGLTVPQKREFIQNLKKKLETVRNAEYAKLLSYCVETYNQTVRREKAKDAPKSGELEDLSSELFARAIATMLSKPEGEPTKAAPKLTGEWRREADGKTYRYIFKEDGTFETDETYILKGVKGVYRVDEKGVLMGPHELLPIDAITVNHSGSRMSVLLKDGTAYDYVRV